MKNRYKATDSLHNVTKDWVAKSGHVVSGEKKVATVAHLVEVGAEGLTPRELAKIESPNDVSGVNTWGAPFTFLRRDGVIVGLAEQREGHHVHVLPEFVQGRETWSGYGHHCATCTCE